MIGIYKIISPSGKIYIGQSNDIIRRVSEHKSGCHSGKLNNSIKKYGFENHIFEILEECEIENLNERERHFQDFYDVLGPNGLNLVLTETSDKSGYISEEVKSKISKTSKGRKLTEETKKRMSEKIVSEKTRRKISLIHKGKITSQETKEKISKANKGNISEKVCKKVINTETGEIFKSIKLASESIGMKPWSLEERLIGRIKNNTNFKYYTNVQY